MKNGTEETATLYNILGICDLELDKPEKAVYYFENGQELSGAGKELLEECRKLHGCLTGEAKLTRGYHLPARYVIHTVGPIWYGGKRGEKELLKSCYENSLRIALDKKLHSIAFPAISTGIYGYPKEQAAETAVNTILDYTAGKVPEDFEVWLVAFDSQTEKLYQQAIAKHI